MDWSISLIVWLYDWSIHYFTSAFNIWYTMEPVNLCNFRTQIHILQTKRPELQHYLNSMFLHINIGTSTSFLHHPPFPLELSPKHAARSLQMKSVTLLALNFPTDPANGGETKPHWKWRNSWNLDQWRPIRDTPKNKTDKISQKSLHKSVRILQHTHFISFQYN